MIVKNKCFLVDTENGYVRGKSGLFSRGAYVDNFEPEFSERSFHDIVATVDPETEGLARPDYFWTIPYYCFSDRAHQALIEANLSFSPQIHQWLPVRIQTVGGKEIGQYWWPKHSRKAKYDVFDYENSIFTVYSVDGRMPKSISKWVLHGEKIRAFDLFYGCKDNPRWFCTPHFKSVVEENGLTGFEFRPADLSFD